MNTEYWVVDRNQPDIKILSQAAEILKQGGLVAFPTETVYGLGANGLDIEAVSGIYQAKGRPADNPLILHIAEISEVGKLVRSIPVKAQMLMDKYWPGPLTIILERRAIVPDIVTGGLETVAIRMPVDNIARQLIRLAGIPIAAPSANISGKPSPTNAPDVLADLNGKIHMVLDGGSCSIGVESTVIDCTVDIPIILRPGGITFEMLTETIGRVKIDPALFGQITQKPRAPGMKYRHYAPKAPVILIEAETEKIQVILERELTQAIKLGKKVGLLVSNPMAQHFAKHPGVTIQNYGSRGQALELAGNLFTMLRRFDTTDVAVIYAEGIGETGLGLAVMNRLRKAAGFHILKE